MFHLFNKVYLQFDSSLSAFEDRIVISQTVGYAVDEPVGDLKPLIAFGLTVDDLIGIDKRFSSYLEFFKHCKDLTDVSNSRLIVYCDRSAFLALFCAWHRIIIEDQTHNTAWQSWQCYIQKESYLSAITNRISRVQFNTIKLSTWDEAEFRDVFYHVDGQKDRQWLSGCLPSLGVEYLLSSVVAGSIPAVKTALKHKMLALANRAIQGELFEAKMQLINATHTIKLQEIVRHTINTIADVFAYPPLAVFNDGSVWNDSSVMVPSSTSSALRIGDITPDKMQQLIDGFVIVRSQLQEMPQHSINVSKISWLRWVVAGDITDAELNVQLMDDDYNAIEMSDPNDLAMLNVLFIDWVLKQHRTNNATAVQHAVLSI